MTRTLRIFAWASFIAQVAIIATGGAVRLTGSGLGCPTWPTCTPDSLVPTDELTYHSLIEFGNRLMTGVVGIVALIVFLLVWRIRRERRDLFVLSFIVGVGIVAQAIVGGITVWTGLNPFIVGFHYVSSLALVCVTAAFLARMDQPAGPRERAVPGGTPASPTRRARCWRSRSCSACSPPARARTRATPRPAAPDSTPNCSSTCTRGPGTRSWR